MSREDMARRVWHVLTTDGVEELQADHLTSAILDAVLPQVTTVAQLEALPTNQVLITDRGATYCTDLIDFEKGVLTPVLRSPDGNWCLLPDAPLPLFAWQS